MLEKNAWEISDRIIKAYNKTLLEIAEDAKKLAEERANAAYANKQPAKTEDTGTDKEVSEKPKRATKKR